MARAGRRRREGVARTASGRRSRAAAQDQEHLEAIATRMRIFGLTERDARDQKAATFIGRLELTGSISPVQYDAAAKYLAVVDAARRAISAPDALKRTDGVAGDRGDSEDFAAWCKAARHKREAADRSVTLAQNLYENRGSALFAALDHLVLRDQPLWHLVGDLRLALNALAHHFGLLGKGRRIEAPKAASIGAGEPAIEQDIGAGHVIGER